LKPAVPPAGFGFLRSVLAADFSPLGYSPSDQEIVQAILHQLGCARACARSRPAQIPAKQAFQLTIELRFGTAITLTH
jgi:hypothetical protein